MKLAITGKGGVGKSTIVAVLSHLLKKKGNQVFLIDADPDMNLASLLGASDITVTPIIELKELITERTGVSPDSPSPFFKMNPKVNDIPENYSVDINGIKLMVMGTIRKGGGGCACPENAFLKSLLNYMMLSDNQWVICDMEAGIEHLGRGTAVGVNSMIIVVEMNKTSIDTAKRIKKLSSDIGLKNICVIANKIQDEEEEKFIKAQLPDIPYAGSISYFPSLKKLSLGKLSLEDLEDDIYKQADLCLNKIIEFSSAKKIDVS